jgi:hypothetical protein
VRRAWAILGVTLTTLVGSLVLAPAASAAEYGCGGSRIDSYPITGQIPIGTDRTFGYIYLYYDSSTGKNCAVTVATETGGYGDSKPMYLRIDRCKEMVYTGNCAGTDSAKDSGDYLYQAGPRSVSAANHCVRVVGKITYRRQVTSTTRIGHCG